MKSDRKTKIYIYQEPIDMRLGFERLSFLIREEMSKNIEQQTGKLSRFGYTYAGCADELNLPDESAHFLGSKLFDQRKIRQK